MTMQANGSTMSAEDEAVPYGMPDATEWETHETQYSNPYSDPEAEWEEEVHYSTPEAEWETHETHYSNPYSTPEAERADQFLPFLAPLALKALPLIGKAVLPMARKLIPFGKRAVSGVLRNVMGGAAPRPGMRPGPAAT